MLLLAVRHKAWNTSTVWTHVFSIFSGDGRWRVERGTGLPGTPHTIHTYICCRCRTAEAAMLPPPPQCSGSNQLQWVVQWRSTWYSVVQCGTVWYTRAAPPLTYAAAVWPQLSEEQQQLPRSGRLTHIYVSTYLQYLRIHVSTETRHRNFSDKIPWVRFNDLSIYLSTYGCGYIIWIEKPFNSSGLITNV